MKDIGVCGDCQIVAKELTGIESKVYCSIVNRKVSALETKCQFATGIRLAPLKKRTLKEMKRVLKEMKMLNL